MLGGVLLGGAGRRMGREKSTIEGPDGRTWARRAADSLAGAGAVAVVGLGGPFERARRSGLAWVPDAAGPSGPTAGLAAGLAAVVRQEAGALALLPCDLPEVTSGSIEPLLAAARRHPARVVVARIDGRWQHAVSVWPRRAATTVHEARAAGVSSLGALLARLEVVTVAGGSGLRDADVPGDLGPTR